MIELSTYMDMEMFPFLLSRLQAEKPTFQRPFIFYYIESASDFSSYTLQLVGRVRTVIKWQESGIVGGGAVIERLS